MFPVVCVPTIRHQLHFFIVRLLLSLVMASTRFRKKKKKFLKYILKGAFWFHLSPKCGYMELKHPELPKAIFSLCSQLSFLLFNRRYWLNNDHNPQFVQSEEFRLFPMSPVENAGPHTQFYHFLLCHFFPPCSFTTLLAAHIKIRWCGRVLEIESAVEQI